MDKNKIASALKFNPQLDAAPQIVAKGKGIVAQNIIDKAIESNVPIYEDEKLSRQLIQLEVGSEIPYALYEVVAEVLVFITQIDGGKK